MGTLLSYSGLSTKIRAMQSQLVNEQQLQDILELPNVPLQPPSAMRVVLHRILPAMRKRSSTFYRQ